MQKIRRSKKAMRLPFIVMIVVLAVGLVGSFAIWSSPNMKSNNPATQKQITPEDQIKNLQVSIDSWEKSLKENPKDFGLLKSLGDARSDQAVLYAQTGDTKKSKEVYAKGMENYISSLDYAPKELEAPGRADIMEKAAFCASNSDQGNTAGALYQQAIQLVPEDFTTRSNYVVFLALYRNDFKAAEQELTAYKALLKAGDSRLAQADELLNTLKEIEKTAQAAQDQSKGEKKENKD